MKLRVEGMTCGHCVRAITTAVQKLEPTARVDIDLASGEVRIASTSITVAAATQAIGDAGYAVVAVLDDGPAATTGEQAAAKSCCATGRA